MRKYKAQSFTVIRKNGKPYMTQMSNKNLLREIQERIAETIAVLRTRIRKMVALWNGNDARDYVALSSRRLHGGMQIGNR